MTGLTMSPFKPSIEEYLKQSDKRHEAAQYNALIRRAQEAVSWGVPSNESIGCTHSELTNIISQLVERLQKCHNQMQHNK